MFEHNKHADQYDTYSVFEGQQESIDIRVVIKRGDENYGYKNEIES